MTFETTCTIYMYHKNQPNVAIYIYNIYIYMYVYIDLYGLNFQILGEDQS